MKKYENTEEGILKITEKIKKELGDIEKYKAINPEDVSSIFLAGAPGAGKTEFIESIFTELKEKFIIIDIDIYRNMFHGYNGDNASEYQSSSVRVANKILSYCFKNNLNFMFDGTFRNYNKVKENLQQCEKYSRRTIIALIFQDPRVSFYWTFLRKLRKKRNVPIDVFIDGFYGSIENTFKAKKDFSNIEVFVASKKYNFTNKNKFKRLIDYKEYNIVTFCKEYKIGYHKGSFTNRNLLEVDILNFNDTLISHFGGKGGILNWGKFTFMKIFYKL